MRQGSAVSYLSGDHLGSTSLVTGTEGIVVSETRYAPFGEVRWQAGSPVTDFTYTGQRDDGFGWMDYNARFYAPYITQFSQPDSIIPDLYNPLDWNRYAYARYNPLKFNDPSGHDVGCPGCNASDYNRLRIELEYITLWGNVQNGNMNDLEALAALSDYAANIEGDCTDCYIRDMGSVITGVSSDYPSKTIMDNRNNQADLDQPFRETSSLNARLGDSGYADIFSDGSDQGRHFWFYVQTSYEEGNDRAVAGNIYHEALDRHDAGGRSFKDFALGMAGVKVGALLRLNNLSPSEVGNYILENFGDGAASAQYWSNLKANATGVRDFFTIKPKER